MRDIGRIKGNWERIAKLHEKFPDWRMGQFLYNLFVEFNHDPFYDEDDKFLAEVEQIVAKWSKDQ